ncbi:MAG: SRPBCC family protein [Chloroflexi bacterium]|nr:SRPBCC family protein [Chloroflexota bacterium]
MNLIDHRILIPTSPERVWHFVGDLKRNAEWQANCRSTTMLTSNTKIQPGARLRITPDRGRDVVLEITAWYDRFGYEYKIVEGGSYRDNKGTVRLQEVPEGTIVQWTFSYRAGLFGGSAGRSQEAIIIDSLRGLYRLITKSKEVETFQAKSLMRDDPGVEARATYRPRHPYGDTAEGSAALVKGQARQPTKPQPAATFDEPAFKPDDTKPRPLVTPATPAEPAPAQPAASVPEVNVPAEPDFLVVESTTPEVVVGPPAAPIVPPIAETPPTPAADVPAAVAAPSIGEPVPQATEPVEAKAPDIAEQPAAESTEPVEAKTSQTEGEPPVEAAVAAAPAVNPLEDTSPPRVSDTAPVVAQYATPSEAPVASPPSTTKRDKVHDTSRISVFEVFGLPKPSETQELEAYSKEQFDRPEPISFSRPDAPKPVAVVPMPVRVDSAVAVEEAVAAPARKRDGHRLYARMHAVKVRRAY